MNYDGLSVSRFWLLNAMDRWLFKAALPFVVLYVALKVMT